MTAAELDLKARNMPLNQAEALATDNGLVLRVGSVDGRPRMLTSEIRRDRVTVDVRTNIVIDTKPY